MIVIWLTSILITYKIRLLSPTIPLLKANHQIQITTLTMSKLANRPEKILMYHPVTSLLPIKSNTVWVWNFQIKFHLLFITMFLLRNNELIRKNWLRRAKKREDVWSKMIHHFQMMMKKKETSLQVGLLQA